MMVFYMAQSDLRTYKGNVVYYTSNRLYIFIYIKQYIPYQGEQ